MVQFTFTADREGVPVRPQRYGEIMSSSLDEERRELVKAGERIRADGLTPAASCTIWSREGGPCGTWQIAERTSAHRAAYLDAMDNLTGPARKFMMSL